MSSGILAPKYRSGHPAGHPKLLLLKTPLFSIDTKIDDLG